MKKAMIVTVGTGKTGEDIAGAIVKSVKDANPERVIFIMTSGSEERTYKPFIPSNWLISVRRHEERQGGSFAVQS